MERTLISFRLYLVSRNKAPRTIDSYLACASKFMAQCDTNISSVGRRDVSDWIGHLVETTSAGNAAVHYRSLQQFFKWHAMEFSVADPMAGMRPPHVPEKLVPVIPETDLKRLLAVTSGKSLTMRRDHLIIRLLIDTGVRASELVGMNIEDVDLKLRVATVLGKGRRPRPIALGAKTAIALDRYLRMRKLDSGPLLVGPRGRLTISGLYQAVERRCAEAKIARVHPHQFRHTFASRWLEQGGNEGDLMMLAGWRSRTMLQRYGRANATDRALAAAKRMSVGDSL